jgi:catechol 2,3-dioxygenase-like lactoylglutathione lyase family enzyme
MKLMGVHHVSVNVDNVDVAIAFYVGTLGLVARPDRPDLGFSGAWLDAGNQQVHLIKAGVPTNQGQHFALQVEDLPTTIGELRDDGVEVSDEIRIGTGRQAFLRDPAGNLIELHQVAEAPTS